MPFITDDEGVEHWTFSLPDDWRCVDCGYPYPLLPGEQHDPSPEDECDNCGGEFTRGGM